MTYAPLNFKFIRLAGVLVEFHTSVPVSAFILCRFSSEQQNYLGHIHLNNFHAEFNSTKHVLSLSLFFVVYGSTAATVT